MKGKVLKVSIELDPLKRVSHGIRMYLCVLSVYLSEQANIPSHTLD